MDKWDKKEKKRTHAMHLQETIGRHMLVGSIGAFAIYMAFYLS